MSFGPASPWTMRLVPSSPWLRITKVPARRAGLLGAAGVLGREAVAVVAAGAAERFVAAAAAVQAVVADAAVEPVGAAVADDLVALRRADDVLEAAQGVVAVAFRLARSRGRRSTPLRVALA